MVPDIVIDTNVLMHAGNKRESRHGSANKLLMKMKDNRTLLCLDYGYDLKRSFIAREYEDNLTYGSVGKDIIVYLIFNKRIKYVERNPIRREKSIIEREVPPGRDRVFAKVTCNSESRTLVSHDYRHYPIKKRDLLKDQININILDSEGACKYL